MSLRRTAACAVLVAGASFSSPSRAHIDLQAPPPRAPGLPDTNLLRGPCGQRTNARAPEGISTFLPGQAIDVVWDVYVQHVSYFRLAFDAEGDDSFSTRRSVPASPEGDDLSQLEPGEGEVILAYVEDREGDLDRVEQRVVLPDVECEQCTLQLTQVTYGLPVREAIYYQCADLVLRADEASEPAGVEPDEPSAGGCALTPASNARAPQGTRRAPRAAWLALGAALLWRRRRPRRLAAGSHDRAGAAAPQGAGSERIHSASSVT